MLAWMMRLIHGALAAVRDPDGPAAPPRDPGSGVRHPRGARPGGRHDAVAVEEPDEQDDLVVVGHPPGWRGSRALE
jgi:hypothetical protein